jgi:hypothetical protein
MRIACVDPGGSTGVVLLEYAQRLQIIDGVTLGPSDHYLELEEYLYSLGELDFIVCERFENRNDDFALLISREYIGVVKYFCQKYTIRLRLQGSSQAKPWATNDKLDSLGVLLRPLEANKHVNDAIRHGIFYMCNNLEVPMYTRQQLLRQMFGK